MLIAVRGSVHVIEAHVDSHLSFPSSNGVGLGPQARELVAKFSRGTKNRLQKNTYGGESLRNQQYWGANSPNTCPPPFKRLRAIAARLRFLLDAVKCIAPQMHSRRFLIESGAVLYKDIIQQLPGDLPDGYAIPRPPLPHVEARKVLDHRSGSPEHRSPPSSTS